MPLRRAVALSGLGAIALMIALAPAEAQMPPCAAEFIPLREQVEKDGMAVKQAVDSKAERGEICNRLKRFVATEAKFIKYMQDNQSWCGIPPDAIAQLQKSHAHSTKLRGQACAAGPVGAGKPVPTGPGLSDALGTSRAPMPNTARTGRGTFDTLTGSPFKQ